MKANAAAATVCSTSNDEPLSRSAARAKFVLVVLHVVLDVKSVHDVADRSAAVGGLMDSAREVGDDVDELGAHRHDEQGDHPGRDDQRSDDDGAGCHRSPPAKSRFETSDEGRRERWP